MYRCDSTFLLEPLEAMMEAKDMYMLVVMDGRDATVGDAQGHELQVGEEDQVVRAREGQARAASPPGRYERTIEESIDDYYKNVADAINDMFLKYTRQDQRACSRRARAHKGEFRKVEEPQLPDKGARHLRHRLHRRAHRHERAAREGEGPALGAGADEGEGGHGEVPRARSPGTAWRHTATRRSRTRSTTTTSRS